MERLRSVLVADRSQADVKARNEKGTYNDVDLNRVLRACSWLAGRLEGYGYSVEGEYFPSVLVSVRADPPEGGTVKGALCYRGETATVTAEESPEYTFDCWKSKGGQIVSREKACSFDAVEDMDLTAVFIGMSDYQWFIPRGEADCMRTSEDEDFYVPVEQRTEF